MRRSIPFIGAILLLFSLLLSACNVPLEGSTPAPAATATSSTGPVSNPEPTPTKGSQEGSTQPAGAGGPVNPAADDSDSMVDETPQGSSNSSGGAASLPGEDFAAKLFRAFEARDFTTLRMLMGDRFSIATFNQSLYEYSSDEALEKLRQSVLAEGSTPAVLTGTDVVALLSGRDPLGEWGPVATPVRAVYAEGLGAQANQQAVLVIGRNPASGQYYWHGILLHPDGYFHTGELLQPVATDVKSVLAKEDLNVRSGPGTEYANIGRVRAGEVAQVTGMSSSGAWWRIYCTQDSTGNCWISADPALTEVAAR